MATSNLEAHVYGWNVGEAGRHHSPIDWLSRAGIGLLSLFAKLTGDASGGSSADRQARPRPYGETDPVEIPLCCNLAHPDKECPYSGDKSNYTCKDGFQKTWWFCCEGGLLVGCGECSSGPTCWQGPWDCSIWWWTGDMC
jgi:hypothetical protein